MYDHCRCAFASVQRDLTERELGEVVKSRALQHGDE